MEQIRGIQFGILSDDEKVRMSVVPVTTAELYEGDMPKPCGLFDPRMGVLDGRMLCPTDEQGHIDCPGYFGHIQLALPVLSYQYIKWIVKILRCVCPMCSYPRYNAADEAVGAYLRAAEGAVRLGRAVEMCKNSKCCDRCGNLLPTTVKPDRSMMHCLKLVYRLKDQEGSAEKEVRFSPEMVAAVFRRMTDADCENIGLRPQHCRPEWLISSVISVPPPSMRPPARKNSQLPMHDDLTYKLGDIIKANKALAKYLERLAERLDEVRDTPAEAELKSSSANAIDCYRRVLQYHCAVLVNNTNQGLPESKQRSGRPMRCIKSRIKGKEGRVRGNLSGKRVDFSARSVITPDPSLSIDQLGVPRVIAQKLTFPQIVTSFNLAKMRRLVLNGAYTYPGCNKIELRPRQRNGRRRVYAMTIAAADKPERRQQLADDLRPGDVVHRHLINDDPVLFNRQPSLHKMSMMCHRVRVMPYNTFRLCVQACTPYNADEMSRL